MKVRKRVLWVCLPVIAVAIAFHISTDQLPTTRCVIVNEQAQTVIKGNGDRCYELTSEEEGVIFTKDGASIAP